VHMLILLRAGIRARAASTGAARSGPAPGRPLVTGLVDDWQWILDDPELTWLGRWAAAAIVREGPRAGAGLDVAVPSLDRSTVSAELRTARNVLCGRTGGLSAPVLGIQGDTGTLPRLPGVGYLNGPDGRPGEVMRAKYLPQLLDPGQAGPDTGEAAGPIAQEHADLDEDFLAAVVPLGYTGAGQVLGDEPMKAALEFLASPAGTGLDIEDALRHITGGASTGGASTGGGDSAGITAPSSDHPQDEHAKAGPIMAASPPQATVGNPLAGLVKDAWCMLRLPRFGVPMALVVAFAGWRGWSTFPRGGLAGHVAGAALAGASYLLLVVLLATVTVHLGRRPARPALTARPSGGGKTRLRDMATAQVRAQPGELPDPPDMAGSLAVAETILAGLRPGPENVRAADPAATAVRWDASGWRDPGRTLNLPESRADKMRHICHLVRREAVRGDVLHRLPQLLLVADDGAVIELFGDRTGTLDRVTS
ncbi:MAG: hypothetical protein ACRDNF_27185, partial [Streptosporangiaceae bacterium]